MRRVPISFGSVRSVRFIHSVRVASLFVVFVRSIAAIDRTTYRLDLRVVVVLIAAVPATKVEVFADVANIIIVTLSRFRGGLCRTTTTRDRASVCFPSPGSVRWVWI